MTGNPSMVKYIHSKGGMIRVDHIFALNMASTNIDILTYLHLNGLDIDCYGILMVIAVQYGSIESITYLVDNGIKLDTCTNLITSMIKLSVTLSPAQRKVAEILGIDLAESVNEECDEGCDIPK